MKGCYMLSREVRKILLVVCNLVIGYIEDLEKAEKSGLTHVEVSVMLKRALPLAQEIAQRTSTNVDDAILNVIEGFLGRPMEIIEKRQIVTAKMADDKIKADEMPLLHVPEKKK